MDLAEAVYVAARQVPKQEEYRLTSQMLRAAVSIPANIAEGNALASRRDYARFISVALGSAAELETLLLIARRTGLLPVEMVQSLDDTPDHVGRMLNRLRSRLID
jgi:four helix bundle protein